MSVIQNVFYVLQFGYEINNRSIYDYNYEDNIFNYGYIGKFDVDWVFVFNRNDMMGLLEYVDYLCVFCGYDFFSVNQVLVNYNLFFGFGFEEGINGQVLDIIMLENFMIFIFVLDNFSVING